MPHRRCTPQHPAHPAEHPTSPADTTVHHAHAPHMPYASCTHTHPPMHPACSAPPVHTQPPPRTPTHPMHPAHPAVPHISPTPPAHAPPQPLLQPVPPHARSRTPLLTATRLPCMQQCTPFFWVQCPHPPPHTDPPSLTCCSRSTDRASPGSRSHQAYILLKDQVDDKAVRGEPLTRVCTSVSCSGLLLSFELRDKYWYIERSGVIVTKLALVRYTGPASKINHQAQQ